MYHSFEVTGLGFVAVKAASKGMGLLTLVTNGVPEKHIKHLRSGSSWKKDAVDWRRGDDSKKIFKLTNNNNYQPYTVKGGKLYTKANINPPSKSVHIVGVMDHLDTNVISAVTDIRKNDAGVYFCKPQHPNANSNNLQDSLKEGYSITIDPHIELSPDEVKVEHMCYWFGKEWLRNAEEVGFAFEFPKNSRLEDYKGTGFLWVGRQEVIIPTVLDWVRALVDHILTSKIDWSIPEREAFEKILVGAYPDELEVQAAIYVLNNYDVKEQTEYLDWIANSNLKGGFPNATVLEVERAILSCLSSKKKV